MPRGGNPWDGEAGRRFAEGRDRTVAGVVRTHLVDRQLRGHLAPPPAEVVDVGGGAGTQAIPLARRGHHVTVVDPSSAMLARAGDALAKEPAEVAERVRLVRAAAHEAPDAVGAGRFAGVLCHGVIPYLDDPGTAVAALCALARPGGTVSLLAKNRAALAVRPAVEGRWTDALAAFDADHEINQLGLRTRGDTVESLTALLAAHDVDGEAWYGVRLFVDWSAGQRREPPPAELKALLEVEYEASRRDPYRGLSRLFHLVGRKARTGHAATETPRAGA